MFQISKNLVSKGINVILFVIHLVGNGQNMYLLWRKLQIIKKLPEARQKNKDIGGGTNGLMGETHDFLHGGDPFIGKPCIPYEYVLLPYIPWQAPLSPAWPPVSWCWAWPSSWAAGGQQQPPAGRPGQQSVGRAGGTDGRVHCTHSPLSPEQQISLLTRKIFSITNVGVYIIKKFFKKSTFLFPPNSQIKF